MDAAFVSQYQSKLDAIDNLEHKAILTALLKTDFPISKIISSLCISKTKMYAIAKEYFGKDFSKKRSQYLAAHKVVDKAVSTQEVLRSIEPVSVVTLPEKPKMPKAKPKHLATVEETVETIEAKTIPKKENSFKASGGILNEKIGFDSFLFFLAQNYLKGEKIKAGALVRLTELNSYVVARYLERAVVLAVHNRLKEPLADDFVRHRENSGITFNAYVADISNHLRPSCPELFSLMDDVPVKKETVQHESSGEIKICLGQLTVTMPADSTSPSLICEILKRLESVKHDL